MPSFKNDEYQITSTFVEAAGKIVLTTIHHFKKANRDGYLNSGIKKGRYDGIAEVVATIADAVSSG